MCILPFSLMKGIIPQNFCSVKKHGEFFEKMRGIVESELTLSVSLRLPPPPEWEAILSVSLRLPPQRSPLTHYRKRLPLWGSWRANARLRGWLCGTTHAVATTLPAS